jgi:hypothetical protein
MRKKNKEENIRIEQVEENINMNNNNNSRGMVNNNKKYDRTLLK